MPTVTGQQQHGANDWCKEVVRQPQRRPQCAHAPSGGHDPSSTRSNGCPASRAARRAIAALGLPLALSVRVTVVTFTRRAFANLAPLHRTRRNTSARLMAALSSSERSGTLCTRAARRQVFAVVRIAMPEGYGERRAYALTQPIEIRTAPDCGQTLALEESLLTNSSLELSFQPKQRF